MCDRVKKSVYVLNSCWMTRYLCEFSCLSMHRCVRTGHTEICNCLHTQSAYEICQSLSGSAILLFSEFCTPGYHNLKREQTFSFMYDWVSHSHKFATWFGKLPQTKSLARLQWTVGAGVLWRVDCHWRGCHMEGSTICSWWWRDLCMRSYFERAISWTESTEVFLPCARHLGC